MVTDGLAGGLSLRPGNVPGTNPSAVAETLCCSVFPRVGRRTRNITHSGDGAAVTAGATAMVASLVKQTRMSQRGLHSHHKAARRAERSARLERLLRQKRHVQCVKEGLPDDAAVARVAGFIQDELGLPEAPLLWQTKQYLGEAWAYTDGHHVYSYSCGCRYCNRAGHLATPMYGHARCTQFEQQIYVDRFVQFCHVDADTLYWQLQDGGAVRMSKLLPRLVSVTHHFSRGHTFMYGHKPPRWR